MTGGNDSKRTTRKGRFGRHAKIPYGGHYFVGGPTHKRVTGRNLKIVRRRHLGSASLHSRGILRNVAKATAGLGIVLAQVPFHPKVRTKSLRQWTILHFLAPGSLGGVGLRWWGIILFRKNKITRGTRRCSSPVCCKSNFRLLVCIVGF